MISDFNQHITVKKIGDKVRQPDGTYKSVESVIRFKTCFANVKADKSFQMYKDGSSEKDTYYIIRYGYDKCREIQPTDKIFWNNKELKPVGECIVENYGNKLVWKIKVKHSA